MSLFWVFDSTTARPPARQPTVVVVNEVTLPHVLNASDAVHLFSRFGVQSDGYSWTSNPPGTTYGRCPDGRGDFATTLVPTRKGANACP
jgi:hypothetical protein